MALKLCFLLLIGLCFISCDVHAKYYGGYQSHHSGGKKEPTVCKNDKYIATQNKSEFICPTGNHTDDFSYCCGEDGHQYCCSFWDDGGRIAGASIGFAAAAIGLVVGVVFLIKCLLKKKTRPVGPNPGVPTTRNDGVTSKHVDYPMQTGGHTSTFAPTANTYPPVGGYTKPNDYAQAPPYGASMAAPPSNLYGLQQPVGGDRPTAYTYST